jgi:hypothetical protein
VKNEETNIFYIQIDIPMPCIVPTTNQKGDRPNRATARTSPHISLSIAAPRDIVAGIILTTNLHKSIIKT